ncbi:MAG: hypothetical protein BWY49_01138 [Candidatus Omnitrophica bacterium ADurb.Bin314]|nr:MAG: hypothetical protein BWY49_01138 [Candidatus Omnitrophica bacterium ADurb.Bin314]
MRLRDRPARDGTGRITRVYPRPFDMFHDGRDMSVRAVGKGIHLAFKRLAEEPVDQHGVFGTYLDRLSSISPEHVLVIDDLHPAPAENEGGTDHDGVADLTRDRDGFLDRPCDAAFRLRNAELDHLLTKELAVFGERDALRRRPEDPDAGVLELLSDVERCLPSELDDDAFRFFLLIDGQHVLDRKRFKIELVGRVIIGRDRFGIAVDHDRFVARRAEREDRVHAGIIELDSLPDAIRPAAEDQYLLVR